MTSWTDATDPSSTWTDESGPPFRHTYGAEYGKNTRILMGDHVKIGGLVFSPVSDPTTTKTDVTDPTDTWSDTDDPSSSWSDV